MTEPNGCEWGWPDWVPADLRAVIEQYWASRGGPSAYRADGDRAGAPALGETVPLGERYRGYGRAGRYVHCWGDVGRLVVDGAAPVIGTLILAGRLRAIGFVAG